MCNTCVQYRLRGITTEGVRTDRNARGEVFCCGEKIWGAVRGRLRKGGENRE